MRKTLSQGIVGTSIVAIAVWWIYTSGPHDDHFYVAVTAMATVAIAVATIWAISAQVATARSVAGVQILLQIMDKFDSDDMVAKRDRLAMLLVGNSAVLTADGEAVLDFFETVGHLTKKNSLDLDMVDNGFSLYLRYYWTALAPFVRERRRTYSDPTLYEHAEWLNETLCRRERVAGRSEDIPTQQLEEFFRTETKVLVPR